MVVGVAVAPGNGTASPRPRQPTSGRKRTPVPAGEAGAAPKGKRDRQRPMTAPTTTASAQLPTPQLPTTQLPSTQVPTAASLSSVAALQLLLQAQKSAHPVSMATSKAASLSVASPTPLLAGPPVTASPSSATPISHPSLSVPQPQKLSDQIKEVFKMDSHPALKTAEKREAESKPLPPSPPLPAQSSGGGILNDTIASLSRSISAQHSLLAAPTNDMGFTHYAERVCFPVCMLAHGVLCTCLQVDSLPSPPLPLTANGVSAVGLAGDASRIPQEGAKQC